MIDEIIEDAAAEYAAGEFDPARKGEWPKSKDPYTFAKDSFIAGANFGKEMRGSDITCPFCNEDGFDKLGLKIHLFNHCEEYRK